MKSLFLEIKQNIFKHQIIITPDFIGINTDIIGKFYLFFRLLAGRTRYKFVNYVIFTGIFDRRNVIKDFLQFHY